MSNAAVDRNLLFGILALQMDFITRDALIDSLRDWTTQKGKSLGQVLVERGDLSAARRELLDPLVDEHVRQHNLDPAASLASLSSISDGTIDWQRIDDVEIQDSLAARRMARGVAQAGDGGDVTTGGASSFPGRFRVLRPHARGGIGEVFLAFDEELQREVALKEIQSRHLRDESHRERFVREAEVTGGLEHPGIVPVYSLGHHGDGRPYYAMRFIRGDSLKEAIERFHAGPKPPAPVEVQDNINTPTVIGAAQPDASLTTPASDHRAHVASREPFESVEFRKLLGRFIDVCQAIEYAHSRGVLHRDLKPGNIMLGKYGETLVVDWGLAKIAGKDDRFANVDEATLVPASGSNIEKTVDGSVIGTPAYMSPEQAAGKLDQLGAATDVYSLGATLYHLLTGRPPFDKQALPKLLARVQRGEFRPPQEINSHVPRALAAICLRAMAQQPEQRYESSAAIAEDIEHWLADEPVNACRETVVSHAARWVRKHRAWALSGTAALALVAIVATVAAFWINGQKAVIAQQERDATQLSNSNAALATDKSRLAEEKTRLAAQEKAAREQADLNAAAAIRQTKLARRNLYTAHMNLVQSAWEDSRVGGMLALLERWRPVSQPELNGPPATPLHASDSISDEDLRGFEWNYWDHLAHSALMSWVGTNPASAMSFGADGKRLVTGGRGPLIVWDAVTGRVMHSIDPRTGFISCLAMSQDGTRLASASFDGKVKVFEALTGKETLTFDGDLKTQLGGVSFTPSLAFSPDGQRLASVRYRGLVKVWNAISGKELLTLKIGNNPGVNSVAFSPDGQQLAVAVGNVVQLWNANSGQEIRTLKGHTGIVTTLAFAPDSQRLVSASSFTALLESDQEVKMWDVTSGMESLSWKKLNPDFEFAAVMAFSPDAKRLAAAIDRIVKVWDVQSGQELLTLKGHSASVRSLAFSPNGTSLVSAGDDNAVKFWDARNGQDAVTLRAETYLNGGQTVNSVAFSPDGQRLAMIGDDLTVKVWNTITSQEVLSLKGHGRGATCVAFSPDGKRLAAGGHDHTIKVWDAISGLETMTLKGHAGGITSVVFESGGDRLVSASHDQTIKVWDSASGNEIAAWNGRQGMIMSVALNPSGKALATAGQDGTVKVWDALTGREIHTLSGHTHVVLGVAFSPDGTLLASASADQTVKVWDLARDQESLSLKGHSQGVTSVAFSPDGSRIVSGSDDKTVKVWDAMSGQESLTLNGHIEQVRGVAFSRDGNRLASVGNNYMVKIWDARPWTPELKAEQQAVSLIWTLSDRGMSKQSLFEAIAADGTISESVRQIANDLSGPFADKTEQQAAELVRSLVVNSKNKLQVLVGITHHRSVSEGARRRATELATALPDNLGK